MALLNDEKIDVPITDVLLGGWLSNRDIAEAFQDAAPSYPFSAWSDRLRVCMGCVMGSISALRGRPVLIVEDEALIALDVAADISANGGHPMVASSVQEALSALSREKIAVAIVDHRLGSDDASEVIRRLETLQIPFVIHSGYDDVDAAWADAPIVHKPAMGQHLMQTVSDLLG